ncbi:MAG: GDP-L-fucose synthase [Thermodesulfovibrionales bacterium]|nr:GDP-L-fucose synthase [Thermodesulfovibrionales bacterium]
MDKSAKILVTGGSGMVGSAIIRCLLKNGYSNIVSTYLSNKPPMFSSPVRFYKIDLTNQLQSAGLLAQERPEYVFVASARVGGIEANSRLRGQFIYENLQIQCNTIHYSYLTGVKKLIFLGSSCIYPKHCPQPMKEDYLLTSPLEYTNEPYAIAKIAGLKMCDAYNLQYGTNFISLMPTNLYGINDNFNLLHSHVIPALIRKFHLARCLQDEEFDLIYKDIAFRDLGYDIKDDIQQTLKSAGITKDYVEIWGSGNARRDFLYVDDLADVCLFVMNNVDFKDLTVGKDEIKNTHINIGSGQDISISDLANLISEIVGFKGDLRFNTNKPDGMPVKLLDNTLINTLGWKPSVCLKDGLVNTYDWYLKSINQGFDLEQGIN